MAEGIHRRVIDNFLERIAAVIDAGGGRTEYRNEIPIYFDAHCTLSGLHRLYEVLVGGVQIAPWSEVACDPQDPVDICRIQEFLSPVPTMGSQMKSCFRERKSPVSKLKSNAFGRH